MWFHRRKGEKPVRPILLLTEYAILTFVWKTLCLGILGEELTDVETTLTKKWCKYSIFLQPDEAHSLNFRRYINHWTTVFRWLSVNQSENLGEQILTLHWMRKTPWSSFNKHGTELFRFPIHGLQNSGQEDFPLSYEGVLMVARTCLYACWICFWIAFFSRNDLTDFYDFWHP